MNFLKPVFLTLFAAAAFFFVFSWWKPELEEYRWYFLAAAIVALTFSANSGVARAAFGTLLLAATLFFVVKLVEPSSVGQSKFDLTEDDLYTLTDGTRSILSELEEPVTINYYVTRDIEGTPAPIKRHIPRVDSFLREIASLAENDLVTLNFIDPEPNTDAEDAALLDQVQQVPITQEDKMIFGASISSLDKKTVIPFFSPQTETQLEYDVVSAIAEVSTRDAPTVGVMSAHNLAVGGQTRRGWIFYQTLQQEYQVANLSMNPLGNLEGLYEERDWGDAPAYLDPEKIPIILVIHPAGITPESEYALDQYLLRGGTVVACVDPFSMVAQESQRPQQPGMPPMGGTPTSSALPELFKKHNIKFDTSQVIIDRAFQRQGNPGLILLNKDAMPVEDDISLAPIENLAFLMGGGFEADDSGDSKVMGPGLEMTRMVESSYKYSQIAAQTLMSQSGQQELLYALGSREESDEKIGYVVLLSGNFETAFPEGKPKPEPAPGEAPEEEEDDEKPKDDPSALSEATEQGNLYLIGDSDFLYDGLSYQVAFGRAQPSTGNGPFVKNIIDQAIGSRHLIGARSRTPVYRSLSKLKEMEEEFREKSAKELKPLQEEYDQAMKDMQEIVNQSPGNSNGFIVQLTPEAQAKRAEAQRVAVNAQKQQREIRKDLQSETDALKARIFRQTTLYVPAAVIALGLLVYLFRRRLTLAR